MGVLFTRKVYNRKYFDFHIFRPVNNRYNSNTMATPPSVDNPSVDVAIVMVLARVSADVYTMTDFFD